MLTPPAGLKVLVATKPVDFRKGADGLAAFAKEVLRQDPLSGVALVFRAKRADRVKNGSMSSCPGRQHLQCMAASKTATSAPHDLG